MVFPFENSSDPDPRSRRYVRPARIIWHHGIEDAGILLHQPMRQATLSARNGCRMSTGMSVLLDFGIEIHGSVMITVGDTRNQKPVPVRLRFGESVSEAMSEQDASLVPGQSNRNDHAIRDSHITLPWMGSREVGMTGFRFVRIDIEGEAQFAEILSVQAVLVYRNIPYIGAFKCSDGRLNRIWQTGAYTVHLNMQEYLWDGIKRDRLVWVGDMHPEAMVISSVFGYNDVVPRSLDLIRDTTPLPEWMNGISTYSLWWIITHYDWYNYHGDLEYLFEQRDYLCDLLDLLCSKIDEENRERLDGHRFMDWVTANDDAAIHAGLQALLVRGLEAGATLAGIVQRFDHQQRCEEAVDRMYRYDVPFTNVKQAAALLAIARLKDPVSINRDVLSVNGSAGMSTFYGYYVLQARALAGDFKGALDLIRSYWGGMLDLGATTFWEHFDESWLNNAGRIDELTPEGKVDVHATYGEHCYQGVRHSLCHGWAGGPTAWITEHILGVTPMEPGCKTLRIRPNLVDLDYAEGTFPTKYGPVHIDIRRGADGGVVKSIYKPSDVAIVETEID